MNKSDFKLCTVAAQQLHGMLIHLDDDLDKPTVTRILASMVGAKDVAPLTSDERAEVNSTLRKLAKGMN